MRHDPAGAALIIMLRSLKMPGMAQAVQDLHEERINAQGDDCYKKRNPDVALDPGMFELGGKFPQGRFFLVFHGQGLCLM